MEQTEIAIQMGQAAERFNEAMGELRPALEALMEALREWARIFVEHIERICELVRRWLLYVKLIRWHVPHRVAKFMANHWPKCWLPAWNP